MTTAAKNNVPGKASEQSARNWIGIVAGIILIVVLTLLVADIDKVISDAFKARGMSKNVLEYPLTAVLIGLAVNGILRLTGTHDAVRPAIKTELFLKIGLVLLGARVAFGDLLQVGVGGLLQASIMVVSVFSFTWWLASRLELPETLKAIMASAVSICGVSAAIAAAGAVLAKKEEVTYIAALVILTALPLMVLMPWLAVQMDLSPVVAGAWFGGNIDTTAAVVGAGTIHGEEAQQVAAVVKMAQNVMIGFVAFALAMHFAIVVERDEGQRPSPRVIWQRFPKFVIGFMLVSLLASLGLFTPALIGEMKTAYKWAFALAFVCIGLEFDVMALREMGWRPMVVYLSATVFNTVLALIVAYIIFGVLFTG